MLKMPSDLRPELAAAAATGFAAAAAAAFWIYLVSMLVMTVAMSSWLVAGF